MSNEKYTERIIKAANQEEEDNNTYFHEFWRPRYYALALKLGESAVDDGLVYTLGENNNIRTVTAKKNGEWKSGISMQNIHGTYIEIYDFSVIWTIPDHHQLRSLFPEQCYKLKPTFLRCLDHLGDKNITRESLRRLLIESEKLELETHTRQETIYDLIETKTNSMIEYIELYHKTKNIAKEQDQFIMDYFLQCCEIKVSRWSMNLDKDMFCLYCAECLTK